MKEGFPKMFIGGGGVMHGIKGDFQGKVTAWFLDGGALTAAEQHRPNGAVHPVRVGGPIWKRAQSVVNSFVRPTVLTG